MSPEPGAATPAGPAAVFERHLDRAREGGASQRQLDVLEAAAATGDLAFEDVNDLVHDTFECFTASGITYAEDEPSEAVPGGPKVPTYSVGAEVDGLTPDQVLALADSCTEKHSGYAEQALQDTDLYQETRDQQLAEEMPAIRACLEENGVGLDPDATPDEVRVAVMTLLNETTDATGGTGSVLCYDDPWTSTPIAD